MTIDAVLSYHLNPATCGVAKFNLRLARELGIRCLPLGNTLCSYPLISIKPEEMPTGAIVSQSTPFDLFLHGFIDREVGIASARRVFAANAVLADGLRRIRSDVIEAWCPSTIDGDATRGGYYVLTFGMAHKVLLPHLRRLKEELERDHPDYVIGLSTAVHEGSPWDQGLTDSIEAMRLLFGDRLRVLGFLGDDALAKELRDCDAVAAFFDPALRANNTTAWAALEAGKRLYTNIDRQSPPLDATFYSWGRLTRLLTREGPRA